MPKSHRCWLVKSEPDAYSWEQFQADGRTAWTGVRSYPGRLHLRAMRVGDPVFFYHSNVGKEVVGLAEVLTEAYPDPTVEADEKGEWSCVDLRPVQTLPKPVPLDTIREDKVLKDIALVRQSRLSVMPVTAAEEKKLRKLGGI